jgi:hypothetical protein
MKSFFSFETAILLILVSFLTGGCAAQKLDFSLKTPESAWQEVKKEPVKTTMGVDKFIDLRTQVMGSDNSKWQGFIPGVLWLSIETELPENYTPFSPFNSRPFNISLAKSISDSVAATNITEQVFYIPEHPYQAMNYRLEGELKRSMVRETGYYYGSFMYVWLARVMGLPYVSYSIELKFSLKLREIKNNEILWEKTITGSREDKFHSVYDLSAGKEEQHLIAWNFARILADKLPSSLVELHQVITENEQINNELLKKLEDSSESLTSICIKESEFDVEMEPGICPAGADGTIKMCPVFINDQDQDMIDEM